MGGSRERGGFSGVEKESGTCGMAENRDVMFEKKNRGRDVAGQTRVLVGQSCW